MADSAASMQSTAQAGMTEQSAGQQQESDIAAQRMHWWRQRLQLDQRMAALLRDLDSGWLGAWR